MSTFSCGCAVDDDARCDNHEHWSCHGGSQVGTEECPPCRRARWLSIGAGEGAQVTRTRRFRKEDADVSGEKRTVQYG